MNRRTIETYRHANIEVALARTHHGHVAWVRFVNRQGSVARQEVLSPNGRVFASLDAAVQQAHAQIDTLVRRGDITDDAHPVRKGHGLTLALEAAHQIH